MSDIKKLQELIGLMREEGISHLRVKEGDSEVEMAFIPKVEKTHPFETRDETPSLAISSATLPSETFITSPMVGIFHRSPSPGAPPFVQVGDSVDEKRVVCIVEAMKVMNEVKAGVAGRVIEVLVEDNAPVEFGTRLCRICIKS